ncbi:MAG: DEAD/DEAH box helicase [Lentisphaerae bacterium]|nr:DEAD/DEAH box helicase [Lentisphaerota bacterium]
MNFIQRVKAVFNGKNAAHAPAVPPSLPKAKTSHAEKPPHGSRSEKKNLRANEPSVVRGGPRKPRKPHAPASPPRRHHGSPSRRQDSTMPWDPGSYQVAEAEGKTRFPDLDLPEVLLHALCDLDFRYCTPIQAKSLPLSLDGADVCGRAQTGTGKTAAFLLTVFKHLLAHPAAPDRRKGFPRALIMAPTRELCMQIARDAEDLGKYTGLRTLAVYGGMDMQEQRSILREKHVDVVVATPGRLLDFRQRQDIDFSKVEILVIDEADRMLDMGFIPDMKRIVYGCPPKQQRQTMLFSATLTPEVTRLATQWTKNPVTVDIENEHVAADTIDQRVYIVTEKEKFTIVYNILCEMKPERVIIFGNRRDSTERLCENLRHQGLDVALLSGAVEQRKRVKVLENFRSGKVPILVATDVAGRGLHIDGIDLIINFNIPEQAEDYVHRIGRTGRVGEKGTSITFADEIDSYYIPAVEDYMKQPLKCVPPPDEWLKPLPREMLARKRRPPREGGFGGRSGPRNGGRGGRSGQRRR